MRWLLKSQAFSVTETKLPVSNYNVLFLTEVWIEVALRGSKCGLQKAPLFEVAFTGGLKTWEGERGGEGRAGGQMGAEEQLLSEVKMGGVFNLLSSGVPTTTPVILTSGSKGRGIGEKLVNSGISSSSRSLWIWWRKTQLMGSKLNTPSWTPVVKRISANISNSEDHFWKQNKHFEWLSTLDHSPLWITIQCELSNV